MSFFAQNSVADVVVGAVGTIAVLNEIRHTYEIYKSDLSKKRKAVAFLASAARTVIVFKALNHDSNTDFQ